MLGSRPLSRTTAFAPRRDSRREKPFHQERPALFVASPNHNPKLPILSISYPSRFRFRPAFAFCLLLLPPRCQYRTCPAFCLPLSISYLSRFLPPAFCLLVFNIVPFPLSASFLSRFLPPCPAFCPRFLPPPAFCLPLQYRTRPAFCLVPVPLSASVPLPAF